MLSAYAHWGRLDEAQRLFDEAPEKSHVSWSSLISGYTRHGHGILPLALFWKMQCEGQRPNQYTWGSVLRTCSSQSLLQRGQQIHAHAIKTNFDLNDFVLTGLVDMYAKCKLICEAEYLFKTVPDNRSHVLWTAMVTGYMQNGNGFSAIRTFRDMLVQRIKCNQFAFASILSACGKFSFPHFGAQVHSCVVQSGFNANVFVESALVDMYAKCRDLCSARRVLMNMEVEDVVSWNSMIVGCVRQGLKVEALCLFQEMHSRNMKVDDFTYPSILNSFASKMDIRSAQSVHCLVVKSGFEFFQPVSNALVDMYAKCGYLCFSSMVFNHMEERDVITWTSLITGYAHNGFHREAVGLFYDMRNAAIWPDHFVYAGIISACAELTILEFGRQLQANLIKSDLGSSLSVDNSLVTLYAKCGCIEDADRVFGMMRVQNVISWTALIVGYAQNGRGKDSIILYNEMIASGTKPDFITFIGLLFACSHAGLVENGRRYFNSMDRIYGIRPGTEHYTCMIDLLGRSGKIGEAKELLNQMDMEPDATMWMALLSACRAHRDIELGERAAMNLFSIDPQNAVPYVMLSNMYSSVGNWECAARVRKMMKTRGLNKEPGCTWIEMNSTVHTFMSEDRSHSRTTEIYRKVDEVMTSIKIAGYVANMNFSLHDTDDEGRELGLAYHSEKLAVAFGLLTAPPGASIRVFKNLRVCGDCHTAMKFISVVFHQHIILRDSNCFHHFREGVCSCRDYW